MNEAGRWFLRSGIRSPEGGVARYYRSDLQKNVPVSTEITGYSVSALSYLHSVTGDEAYRDAAMESARFLANVAWDAASHTFPFEIHSSVSGQRLAYFFDLGIIARGLITTGAGEFRESENKAKALLRALEAAHAKGSRSKQNYPKGKNSMKGKS